MMDRERELVADLPEDVVAFVVALVYQTVNVTTFRSVMNARRVSHQYRRIVDRDVLPLMTRLPFAIDGQVPASAFLKFKALRRIEIWGWGIERAIWSSLPLLRQLEELSIDHSDRPRIAQSLTCCVSLTSLSLSHVSDLPCDALQSLTRLTTLKMCLPVIPSLKPLTSLTALDISCAVNIRAYGGLLVPRPTSLKSLRVPPESAVTGLELMTNLEDLSIGVALHDHHLRMLTRLTSLKINYGNPFVSNDGLRQATQLRHLDISECDTWTYSAYGVETMTNLESLVIYHSRFSQAIQQ